MGTNTSSSSRSKTSATILWLTVTAVFAALLTASKQALAALPNVELVSILIISFSVVFGWRTLPGILIFVLVQGVLYGFNYFWLGYVYLWPLLMVISILLRRFTSPVLWCIVCGAFGFLFGGLWAILLYLPVPQYGPRYALAWWINGLAFDGIHGVSNLITGLLFTPLVNTLVYCRKKMRI